MVIKSKSTYERFVKYRLIFQFFEFQRIGQSTLNLTQTELGKLLSEQEWFTIEYADFSGDKIKTDKITGLNLDNKSPTSALQYKTASLSKSPLFCNLTCNRRANNFSVQK